MDLDGDGRPDLVSGSFGGIIFVFRGTDDGFAERSVLVGKFPLPERGRCPRRSFNILQSASVSTPDWDDDGDVDLVAGTNSGFVYLLLNRGGPEEPEFAEPEVLIDGRGGDDATRYLMSAPCVTDWDGDGDLDLVVGTKSSGVYLHRNLGSRSAPKLDGGRELRPGGEPFRRGHCAKPYVADVNGDGRPDLLIGNCEPEKTEGGGERLHGYVYLALRRPAPADEEDSAGR